MKAYLQWRDEPFAKTHNLRALVIQAATLDKGFDAFEKPAEILTPYVSAFRYPGGADEPMPERCPPPFGWTVLTSTWWRTRPATTWTVPSSA